MLAGAVWPIAGGALGFGADDSFFVGGVSESAIESEGFPPGGLGIVAARVGVRLAGAVGAVSGDTAGGVILAYGFGTIARAFEDGAVSVLGAVEVTAFGPMGGAFGALGVIAAGAFVAGIKR